MNVIKKNLRIYAQRFNKKEIDQELEKQKILSAKAIMKCYHPKMSREMAESRLKREYDTSDEGDGIFLIRDCSSSPDDYSLSMIYRNNCYHYKILHATDSYYVFADDESSVHNGIDNLIKTFREKPHGLVCCLSKCYIVGEPLPLKCRIYGFTNLLHETASKLNDLTTLRHILSSIHCPDPDEKSAEGRTALDIACEYNNVDAIKELVRYKPNLNVNVKAEDGYTPLHRAADSGSIESIEYLLKHTLANPTERLAYDNLVPLHLAAMNNKFMCVKALLKFDVPDKPRTSEDKLPIDLALDAKATDVVNVLRRYQRKPANTKTADWLHDSFVTRDIAQKILQSQSKPNLTSNGALFLVRRTQRVDVPYVLSLLSDDFHHYEICLIEDNKDGKFYYIDDGPYFRQLEHLIEHYMKYEDGLPATLKYSISKEIATPIISNMDIKEKNEQVNRTSTRNSVKTNAISRTRPKTLKTSRKENDQPYKEIKMNEIIIGQLIGEGEFGSVYEGTYSTLNKKVAIKRLKDYSGNSDFKREAEIMSKLSDHPNILKIYGMVEDKTKRVLFMIQELMCCSVLEKLWEIPRSVNSVHIKQWAAQIVSGMAYMEDKKIVHRDLAARNILLESQFKVKISDFGLSRQTNADNIYQQKGDGKIPIKWYAPESIENCTFTSKSDVWSFGVTLWEMFSYGDSPYGDKSGIDVYNFIKSNRRLSCPAECPNNTYIIMQKCWSWDEANRPSFKELLVSFSNDSDYQELNTIYCDANLF